MSFAAIFFSYYIVLVSTAEPQNARHQLPLPLFSPIYSPFLQLNYPASTRLSDSIKTVEVASTSDVVSLQNQINGIVIYFFLTFVYVNIKHSSFQQL